MLQKVINIGILTPYVEGFYFGGFIDGIHDIIKNENARLIVIQTSTNKHPSETATYDYPLAINIVDGWIVLPQSINSQYLDKLCALGKPVVMLTKELSNPNCRYVLSNEYECFKSATKHLIDHGHKKIAFAACLDIVGNHERLQGYLDALEENNIPMDPNLIFKVSDAMRTGGYEAAESMLEAGVPLTAIVASTDYIALSIIEKLKQEGYKFPEDIAIVSCDDTEYAKSSVPPLSSIKQNIAGLSSTAAQVLLDFLKGRSKTLDNVTVKGSITLRRSCGCAETTDPADMLSYGKEGNNNKKVIELLGNVINNNSQIGNYLTRADSSKIKSMSWLAYTNFHWGCLGLLGNGPNRLFIEYFYSRNNLVEQNKKRFDCSMENFPPLNYLPDTTHSGGPDIVWLHPLFTQTHDLGVVALVGPIEKTKMLSKFDTMGHCFDLMAFALERESMSENRYRNLLNSVGQGFLCFDEDLMIENEYSSECWKIFGQDISGKCFPDVISPDDASLRDFLYDILHHILHEKQEKKTNLLLSLLPGEFIHNHRNIKVEYKLVDNFEQKNQKKMLLVLTDITDKRNLEDKVDSERNTLKMVVKSLMSHDEFISILNDYYVFCKSTLHKLLHSDLPLNEIISKIYMLVHTFKGNFSQLDLSNMVDNLNKLETEISEIRKNIENLSHKDFVEFMQRQNMHAWIEKDLSVLNGILGEQYFNRKNTLTISESRIRSVEEKVKAALSPTGCKMVLPELEKMRYKTFDELVKSSLEYTYKLAHQLDKPIYPIELEGGDIPLAADKYKDFTECLIHVFQNAVVHGIEPSNIRVKANKDLLARIKCKLHYENEQLFLSVSDDGRGIDMEKIKTWLKSGEFSDEFPDENVSQEQLLDTIFLEEFSTSENISDLSGSGIGLAVIKNVVDRLGGTIEVTTAPDAGTTFRFTLPYQKPNVAVEAPTTHIIQSVVQKTSDLLTKNYGFEMINCSSIYTDKNMTIDLKDVTSFINMKGIVNGKLIISANEQIALNMTKAFLFEEPSPEERDMYVEAVLSECSNVILGNSFELFGDMEEHLFIETPEVLKTKNGLLKYTKAASCLCYMAFNQGDLNLYFITLSKD